MARRFAKKLCIFSALLFFVVGALLITPHGALAQGNTGSQVLGLNAAVQQNTGLGNTDIRVTIANIIRVALGLLGIVSVALMVYAGYEWMTAGGNDEQIESAKKIIKNAVIGLVIILSAYAIVSFVISKLLEATTGLPAHCFDGVQNYDETGVDTGGSCGANTDVGGGILSRSLYITSLPSAGDACVANFHPVIFFNRPVDIGTFDTSTIYIEKTNGDKAFGIWSYLTPNNKSAVKFLPNGSCGSTPDNQDCFEPNTSYSLVIPSSLLSKQSNIKSIPVDELGVLSLRCDIGKQCGPVNFKTGVAIDTQAPSVTIVGPNGSLEAGTTIPVQVDFSDDVGVRNIVLNSASKFFKQGNYNLENGRANSAVSGDFNSDGTTDVVVGVYGSTAQLFTNDGTGNFKAAPSTISFGSDGNRTGTGLLAADFNNDSVLDLVQFSSKNKNLELALGNGANKKGDGTFHDATQIDLPILVTSAVATDLNNDGFPDIIASGRDANLPATVAVLINKGDGTFKDPVFYSYGTRFGVLAVGDFNNDGIKDFIVSDSGEKIISVQTGKGDGTFNPPGPAIILPTSGVTSLAVGDLNGDGKLDLVAGYASPVDMVYVATGQGDGTFVNPVAYQTKGKGVSKIVINDLNYDGIPDVAVSSLDSSNFSVFYNKGNGSLLDAGAYPLPHYAYDLLSDNFNKNGMILIVGIVGDDNPAAYPALNVFFSSNPVSLSSQTIEGCVTSGRATLPWKTTSDDVGTNLLSAVGVDVAAHPATDLHEFSLLPNTCFNNVLDPGEDKIGPKACGKNSVCGLCAGSVCSNNTQCAGGVCLIVPGQDQGVCVNKPQITDFSPRSAGKDSFVSIKGYFFGSKPGIVSFATKNNPDPAAPTDWKDAPVVSCGGYSGWTDRQIIVQVPDGIVTGPIRVITAGANGVPVFIDTTELEGLPDFIFTNEQLPGICSITPPHGSPGSPVIISGKGFDALNSNDDFVTFDNLKSVVGLNGWSALQINTTVPNVEQGFVGVTVTVNGKQSNSFEFEVLNGSNSNNPIITNVTPTSGPHGQYITIEGSGFGDNVGEVWFKDSKNAEALDPAQVFDFPKDICSATDYWHNDRIIAKFPKTVGDVGTSYYIQVQPQDRTINASLPDDAFKYLLTDGVAAPGLCSLNPPSGPVPFVTPQVATLKGEYFTADTDVYFAKKGQTQNPTSGALAQSSSWTSNELKVLPSASTITGNVFAYRRGDRKLSNPIPFATIDCTTQGNLCGDASQRCCVAGPEKGFCKSKNELCSGETRSTGYIWRFSTKDIPEIPHVVERCDDTGQNTNVTIPSPSPNIRSYQIWNDVPHVATSSDPQFNVCRTAVSFVEFSTRIDPTTVKDESNMAVYRCTNFNADTTCATWTSVVLDSHSYTVLPATASSSYVAIQPAANSGGVKQWDDNSLYQVVLKKSIKSAAVAGNSANIGEDAPCDGNGITNSAYCFQFRTDSQDCKLRAVIVAPYTYFTTYLEDPMLYHDPTGAVGKPVPYTGNGLSTQRCVMMDVSGYDWNWQAEKPGNTTYADIHDGASQQTAHVSSFINTKGVTAGDKVNISATASMTNQTPKTGVSPLTIDLSDPEVVDNWPTCLEACTNAEVGVKFNMTMNSKNLPGSPTNGTVQLLACDDENCLTTHSVLTTNNINGVQLDAGSHYTVLKIANSTQGQAQVPVLSPNTKYKVTVSVEGDPADDTLSNQLWASYKYGDISLSNVGKKYNKQYTWTFKTKKEACQIDRVEVTPKDFFAKTITDRSLFSALPYSAPDACDASGQKLNPWTVNWQWNSADQSVATVQTFSTQITNPNCTDKCIRKGSDVPFGSTSPFAICGNGIVEAGEDCDAPDASKHCGLDCRLMGNTVTSTRQAHDIGACGDGFVNQNAGEQCDINDPATKINCSQDCRHLGSDQKPNPNNPNLSICGNGSINGQVGAGEDCDIGIPGDLANPLSAMGCSQNCLHQGTTLAKRWCQINFANGSLGGFTRTDFDAACKKALSVCGDGFVEGDEDPICESLGAGHVSPQCDNSCRLLQGDSLTDIANNNGCGSNPNNILEGCSSDLQHLGSSVLYATPSVCGDGVVGTGEDATCEVGLTGTALNYNPWALAKGVGLGPVDTTKTPPQQSTAINASTNEKTKNNATVSGAGNFTIQCGYKTDADCAAVGVGLGVGGDSCCYARPTLVSTFPVTSTPIQHDVCPNTYIAATFNQKIDSNSLPGNVLIATGSDNACPAGTVDVFDQIVRAGNSQQPALAWYVTVYQKVANFVRSLFGLTAQATVYPDPVHWCVGQDTGTPTVEDVPGQDGNSRVKIQLDHPLATQSNYAIVLTPGVKSDRGVSIGATALNWKFTTANKLCEVNNVTVSPATELFSKAGATSTFTALGSYTSPRGVVNFLQPIPGYYDWNFIWGPTSNSYVTFSTTTSDSTTTLSALNQNGELDIRAAANITQNTISSARGIVATGNSHVTVFLCENPWPPKAQKVGSSGPFTIFPYEDKNNNNDDYDPVLKQFNNQAIPPTQFLSDGYFNFRTYYCADAGAVGTTDDLPYMSAAVQTSTRALSVLPNTCGITGVGLNGNTCSTDADCGFKYSTTTQTFVAAQTSLCASVVGGVPTYFVKNNMGLSCSVAANCDQNADFATWKSGNANATTACVAAPAVHEQNKCYHHRPLKRFFFTSNKVGSSDTIGIQVFENRNFLTAEQWFEGDELAGGQGFTGNITKTTIDGYPAVTDGNNYYIEGLNLASSTNALTHQVTTNLYGTIYLLSINSDAHPETRQVFDAMRKNLSLNTNLTNYGYCGTSIDNPGFDKQCSTDFDCPNGQVCSDKKTKLQRTYTRLRDAQTIENLLELYYQKTGTYPDLATGSLLPHQTISTWPQSWTLLSNQIGAIPPLPADPVNQLGVAGTCASNTAKFCTVDGQCGTKTGTTIPDTCTLHDAQTGWSTADRRFSFACATSSLAYRYIFSTTTAKYDLRIKIEDFGKIPDNTTELGNIFDPYGHLQVSGPSDQSGICNSNEEISSIDSGYCGDGIINVNRGEACDPGKDTQRYGVCGAVIADQIKVDVCNKNCQWSASTTKYNSTFIQCKDLSTCGNGIKELGEVCDQGPLNGTYNSCNKTCSGFTNLCGNNRVDTGELCEITDTAAGSVKKGWCLGGINDGAPCNPSLNNQDCNTNGNTQTYGGVCSDTQREGVKYALAQGTSCGFDCRSRGPYCGDGIVQPEFGEQCDGNDNSCPVGNVQGVRTCTNKCKYADTEATLWQTFDDATVSPANAQYKNSGTVSTLTATCATANCPVFSKTAGRNGTGAATFNPGQKQFLSVAHDPAIMATSSFSIEMWIKPSDYGVSSNRILEKGGWQVGPGYGIEFNINKKVRFSLWRTGVATTNQTFFRLDSDSDIPADGSTWTHLVFTYDNQTVNSQKIQTMRIYVNGKMDAEKIGVNEPDWLLENTTDPLYIGKASDVAKTLYFPGTIEDLRYYKRALQAAEIVDHAGNPWVCRANLKPVVAETPAGKCGDGVVDANESCDKAGNNGITCTPGYNQTCTYCSKDCAVVTVEPKQYCGNGIIEAGEQCDADPKTSIIYMAKSSVTSTLLTTTTINGQAYGFQAKACNAELNDPNTAKTGTKQCNACQNIVNQETGSTGCIVCGLVPGGEKVAGGIVNVIMPQLNGAAPGPLYNNSVLVLNLLNGTHNTSIASRGYHNASPDSYTLAPSLEDAWNSTNEASISTDPMCSVVGGNPSYSLSVSSKNAQNQQFVNTIFPNFSVLSDPKNLSPWRYDLILSPIIPNAAILQPAPTTGDFYDNQALPATVAPNARPNDIRVVVSWRGEGSLVGGFLVSNTNGAVATVEQSQFNVVPSNENSMFYYNNKLSSLAFVPALNATQYVTTSIWYHGQGNTVNQTHVMAFTIDTNQSKATGSMLNSQYSFYVRTADNLPLSTYRLRNVEVQVYYPESGSNGRAFGRPVETLHLEDAALSDNARATYWHVANIKSGATINGVAGEADITKRFVAPIDPITNVVVPSGRIVSSPSQIFPSP